MEELNDSRDREPRLPVTSVTVATVPSAKVSKGTKEVDLPKVWSEGFHEIKLRVSALPEHEVTQPLFP